jgi:hypothetical protein
MIAHIQKLQGEFANINTLTAFLGFREKGYEVRCFELADLPNIEITPDTPVVGGIPVVVAALIRLGISPPELPSIPTEIEHFAQRRIWTTTMESARVSVERGEPVFVKPMPADRKLFAGLVFARFRDTIATAHVPPDYPVVCSEPVQFLSEYRAFVLDRDIIGLRHYKGDFRIFPDIRVIEAAVGAYTSSPSAYGIDFGVTLDGRTLLVEANEGHSLGCYGLTPLLYSSIIERRWNELTVAARTVGNQK